MSDSENNDAKDNNTQPETAQTEAAASNQRLRAILAGLVTVAILAVLAIAVFSGGDDGDDPVAPVATTVPSDGTGGGDEPVDGQPGEEELGSLALSGYLCPEPGSDESECIDSGPVAITGAVVQLVDGRTFSLEGVEQGEDGVYAWLNIPIGEYILLSEGLTGPDGALPRTVIGSTEQVTGGWRIANLDPNQPADVRILFDKVGEGTAVG